MKVPKIKSKKVYYFKPNTKVLESINHLMWYLFDLITRIDNNYLSYQVSAVICDITYYASLAYEETLTDDKVKNIIILKAKITLLSTLMRSAKVNNYIKNNNYKTYNIKVNKINRQVNAWHSSLN